MRLAIIGDRGIPARYSGFSTLTEELASRLVRDHGADVTVYCRNHYYEDREPEWRGVHRVFLPAPGGKSFESLIHSTLSIAHALFQRYDAILVLDPGNAPLCLPLRLRRWPVLLHTDGLGWQRRKWSKLQRRYYKWSEWVSVQIADALVTDARAMQRYYRDEYGAGSVFIPYSGVVGGPPVDDGLRRFGLQPGGYYLVVARLEPENNVDLIIREYLASSAMRPLVVVGGSPYGTTYSQEILNEPDPRVRSVGAIYDSPVLNGLYRDCYCYIHGHEVGGTNPSLLRAMQAGAPCAAVDVVFTREVLGEAGLFFGKAPGNLAAVFSRIDGEVAALVKRGQALRTRAGTEYRWDAIAAAFEALIKALIADRRAAQGPDVARTLDVYRPGEFPMEPRGEVPEESPEETRVSS
jgi:glycosyltransferase involved in cell wall biosynthesis